MSLHREEKVRFGQKKMFQENQIMLWKILSYSNIGFRHLFLAAISYKIPIHLCLEHFTKKVINWKHPLALKGLLMLPEHILCHGLMLS